MPSREYVENVVNKHPFGWEYTQDPYSIYTFPFEEVDLFSWYDLAVEKWYYAFYAGAIYIAVIFGLRRLMRDRPAFELKWPLFLWNFSLGVFSIMGLIRCLPGFIRVLSMENGFYKSICFKKETNIPTAFWTLMFILSKFWELGDTVFIVLRKRPLIFLQWYHHLVTMTVVWVLAPLVEPIARWYTVLNYGVHSLMYPYFAFKVIGYHIPSLIANFITTLQLIQMILGFFINVLTMYWQKTGQDCIRYPVSIQVFSLVYGSFILLFGKLFYDSVIKAGRRKRARNEQRVNKAAAVDVRKLSSIAEEIGTYCDENGNRIKAKAKAL